MLLKYLHRVAWLLFATTKKCLELAEKRERALAVMSSRRYIYIWVPSYEYF